MIMIVIKNVTASIWISVKTCIYIKAIPKQPYTILIKLSPKPHGLGIISLAWVHWLADWMIGAKLHQTGFRLISPDSLTASVLPMGFRVVSQGSLAACDRLVADSYLQAA